MLYAMIFYFIFYMFAIGFACYSLIFEWLYFGKLLTFCFLILACIMFVLSLLGIVYFFR